MDNQKIHRNFYLAHLITEELAGTISADRHRELEDWLNQSEANRMMYDDLCRELSVVAGKPLPETDTQEAWASMQDRKHHQRVRKLRRQVRRWAVAASVVALLGGSVFVYFHKASPEGQEVQLAEVVPGSARARLILDGGEVVDLENTDKEKALRVENGVTIRVDSGKVTYLVNEKPKGEISRHNTLEIPRGGEYFLQLSDGTRVWLNSATTLKYPAVFSGGQRVVELEGEACFEVAHDSVNPFIVRTFESDVRVYGTSFNVCAYREDVRQYTTLLSGSVGVNWKGKEVRLQPGEQAVWDVRMNKMEVHSVNPQIYCSWHTGAFVFENRPLEEVLDRLGRWYDVKVFYVNPEVKNLHFTGDLNRYDDFGKILEFLEMTGKVKFTVNGKTIMVN